MSDEHERDEQEEPVDQADELDEAEPAAALAAAGETWLEPWHVCAILSKRRSGKSTLATVLTSYMTRQTIVFLDVKRAYRVHEGVVCLGPEQLRVALAARPRPRRIHYVPMAFDADEWDDVFRACFEQTDVTVQVDECVPWPLPATGPPKEAIRYVMQGARQRDGLIACTGRWRGVSIDLKAQANVIVIFPGGLSADELTEVGKEMGDDLAEAAQELGCRATKPIDQLRYLLTKTAEIGPYAFLWYDRDRGLFRMLQIPEHLIGRAIATEITPR